MHRSNQASSETTFIVACHGLTFAQISRARRGTPGGSLVNTRTRWYDSRREGTLLLNEPYAISTRTDLAIRHRAVPEYGLGRHSAGIARVAAAPSGLVCPVDWLCA